MGDVTGHGPGNATGKVGSGKIGPGKTVSGKTAPGNANGGLPSAPEPSIHRVIYFFRKILRSRIFVGHAVARLRALGRGADAVDQIAYLLADRRSIARAEALGFVDRAFVDASIDSLHGEFAAILKRYLADGSARVSERVGLLSREVVVGEADFVTKARAKVIARGMVAVDQSVVFHAAEAALRRAVAGLSPVEGHVVTARVDADLRFMADQAVARDLKNMALATSSGIDDDVEGLA